MPTINKKPVQVVKSNREERTEFRQKLYRSSQWRKLRNIYLQEHPLCEECLKNGIVNGGDEQHPLQVHHISSPFDYNICEMERWSRLLDYFNLKTLCEYHHGITHAQQQKKNKEKNNIEKCI